jgi:GTPase SAR1 family protein
MLYKLKSINGTAIPTISFQVETVDYKSLNFVVIDTTPGQQKIRALWRHYFAFADALVWVVDATDRDRIVDNGTQLASILKENNNLPNTAVLLVLINKTDLPNAMSTAEIYQKMNLDEIDIPYHLQRCSLLNADDGLYQGKYNLLHANYSKGLSC